jgi:hypothetical protein
LLQPATPATSANASNGIQIELAFMISPVGD